MVSVFCLRGQPWHARGYYMTRLSCDALFLRRVIGSMTRLQGPQQKHGRTPPCCGPLQSIEGEK